MYLAVADKKQLKITIGKKKSNFRWSFPELLISTLMDRSSKLTIESTLVAARDLIDGWLYAT